MWTDGDLLDDEQMAHRFNNVVNGTNDLHITDAGTLALPGEDGSSNQDYLETKGPGGTPAWTVSFWFRTPQVDQGESQGLFSNNRKTDTNFSWEVIVHDGMLQLRSTNQEEPNPMLSNTGSNKPSLKPNTWHQVVVRKTGSGDVGELYLGTTDGISKVGTMTNNPGGLQMFRVGINRTSDVQYRAELANLAIFRNDSVSIEDLNKAGPVEND
jgi:hypothetical protein